MLQQHAENLKRLVLQAQASAILPHFSGTKVNLETIEAEPTG
jgi:hypothetical protein